MPEQVDREGRSLSRLAVDVDETVVLLDDAINCGQSHWGLRGAGGPSVVSPLIGLFYRRLQPLLDQVQHRLVADTSGHRFHQFAMRDRIKVPAQVRIDYLGMPRVQQRVYLPNGIVGALPRPVRILLRLEIGLEDWLKYQHCRHLHHSITDPGNAQRSLFSICLGYPHPTYRTVSRQLVHPSFYAVRFDILKRLSVDPF